MKHLHLTIIALFYAMVSYAYVGPIHGLSQLCVGNSGTYTDSAPGGIWSSSSPIIVINPTTGIATGVSSGTTTITYTVGASYTLKSVTINPLPYPISSLDSVCVGSSIFLTDPTPAGVWACSTPLIATITSGTGLLTGVSGGVATISYVSTSGCAITKSVTVNPFPAPITGPTYVCTGFTATFSDPTPGGTWSSYLPAVGSINTAGVVTGISTGTTAIYYSVRGCPVIFSLPVIPPPMAYTVTGGGSYCSGGGGVPVSLVNSQVGVFYHLYNGTSPVGVPVTGTGSAISFGLITAPGTYTVIANLGTSCFDNMIGSATITTIALPAIYTLTGFGSYCAGGYGVPCGLSGSSTGVNYALYNGTTLVTTLAGTGSPISFGTIVTPGTYTVVATDVSTGCTSTTSAAVISLIPRPVAYAISPGGGYCFDGSGIDITLSGSDSGISYLLYRTGCPAGLPISGTGSALDFGYQRLAGDYVVSATDTVTGCRISMTGTAYISYLPVPELSVSGPDIVCGGSASISVTGAESYLWMPTTGLSCTTCSSVISNPPTTTAYTVWGANSSGCTSSLLVKVYRNRVSGHISHTGLATDSFKVWLIQFNPSDSSLAALESTNSCMDSGMPYYEFDSPPIGYYMVKAQLSGSLSGTSGYIPTYGLSSPYWYSASAFLHLPIADTQNINMIYGTVPPGPGFISGLVVWGAGKGTSDDMPLADMTILLKDASGSIIASTTTATNGTYYFSNLPEGNYTVYPEFYQYFTTPSATITLAPGLDSALSINFKLHTSTRTITPYDNSKVPQPMATGISIYPNPASATLNITWNHQATGTADVTIADMIGHEAISQQLQLNAATGNTQVDLSTLAPGIYTITIRTSATSFTSKLVRIHD